MSLDEEIRKRMICAAQRVHEDRLNEIEDALAGLMASGVRVDQITLMNYVAVGEMAIVVDGTEKYRFPWHV